MSSTWPNAVREAVRRVAFRHGSDRIERQVLLEEELDRIVAETQSMGETPEQTLSRVLQDLRNEGMLQFVQSGQYRLTPPLIDADTIATHDLTIDQAIRERRLVLTDIPTGIVEALTKRRVGQDRVRQLTLENYDTRCAVCDVVVASLLVASHVVPWAESPEGRGDLANVICLCSFHDSLFEQGFWTLSDDLAVLVRQGVESETIKSLLPGSSAFRVPGSVQPAPTYLRWPRLAHGYCESSA